MLSNSYTWVSSIAHRPLLFRTFAVMCSKKRVTLPIQFTTDAPTWREMVVIAVMTATLAITTSYLTESSTYLRVARFYSV